MLHDYRFYAKQPYWIKDVIETNQCGTYQQHNERMSSQGSFHGQCMNCQKNR